MNKAIIFLVDIDPEISNFFLVSFVARILLTVLIDIPNLVGFTINLKTIFLKLIPIVYS